MLAATSKVTRVGWEQLPKPPMAFIYSYVWKEDDWREIDGTGNAHDSRPVARKYVEKEVTASMCQ
jgi:hypothetical protein